MVLFASVEYDPAWTPGKYTRRQPVYLVRAPEDEEQAPDDVGVRRNVVCRRCLTGRLSGPQPDGRGWCDEYVCTGACGQRYYLEFD